MTNQPVKKDRKCLLTQQNAEASMALFTLLFGWLGVHVIPRLPVDPNAPTPQPVPVDPMDSMR